MDGGGRTRLTVGCALQVNVWLAHQQAANGGQGAGPPPQSVSSITGTMVDAVAQPTHSLPALLSGSTSGEDHTRINTGCPALWESVEQAGGCQGAQGSAARDRASEVDPAQSAADDPERRRSAGAGIELLDTRDTAAAPEILEAGVGNGVDAAILGPAVAGGNTGAVNSQSAWPFAEVVTPSFAQPSRSSVVLLQPPNSPIFTPINGQQTPFTGVNASQAAPRSDWELTPLAASQSDPQMALLASAADRVQRLASPLDPQSGTSAGQSAANVPIDITDLHALLVLHRGEMRAHVDQLRTQFEATHVHPPPPLKYTGSVK